MEDIFQTFPVLQTERLELVEINRIEAEVMPGNIYSEKALKRLGFKKEGLLRDWMYWNKKHYDMIMFSLLRDEKRK